MHRPEAEAARPCHPAGQGKEAQQERGRMASYHLSAKMVCRSKGQSVVHTAAYNARCQLHDERHDRDTKDYDYKGKPEFSGIFAPKGAPDWVHDREQLWNRAEGAENRKDAQTARNIDISIPHELNAEQRRHLVTDFVREAFVRKGMVADAVIHEAHEKNNSKNIHVHILATLRPLDGDNFAKTKERDWTSKAELEQTREKWAHMGARALERAGHQQEADRFRHGHKTLAEQQKAALERGDDQWAEHCDKEAQIHKGAAVSAMEQKNDPRLADNEIAREAQAIDDRNAARAEIREAEKELAAARQEADKQQQPEQAQPKAEPTTAQPETIRLYRGIDTTNDALGFPGEALFFTPDKERAASFGKVHYVDVTPEELRRFDHQPHGARFHQYDTEVKHDCTTADPAIISRLAPLREHDQRQPEPAKAQPTPEVPAWQQRDATPTVAKLSHMMDAAERGGQSLGAALWQEGITLARVDRAGIAIKDAQYSREFETEKAQGDPAARLRRSVVQEGELVALNKSGEVYRLNPKFLQLDRLEQATTGGNTPSLSAMLDSVARERAQEQANFWQRRDITGIEQKISELHDRAAFQDGKPFRRLLHEEGIILARVDKAGIAIKDAEYRRDFENEKLQGNADAELRTSRAQEGELVAVTKSGHVHRLNPRHLDRADLEKAIHSSGHETATLSGSLKHFAEARQQQRADRQAAQHAGYGARETIRQQNAPANNVRQETGKVLGAVTGKDAGLKVATSAGVKLLEKFVDALFSGTGDRPKPTNEQRAQQRALIALENIADSIEAGENLKEADVMNLLPAHIDELKRGGDSALRLMISQLEQYRKDEQDRVQERGHSR